MNVLIVKALVIWMLIAAGEILNGNIRVRFLYKKYGIKRAKILSFFMGTTIIYAICWFTLPWIDPSSLQEGFLIGLLWMLLMLCLDLCFGKYVFHFHWSKIIEDFDFRKGNLLGVGMVLLLLCPAIIYLLALS